MSFLPGMFPAGAAATAAQPFGVRYVGGYAVTFSASATGSATIPAADFGPADASRQLLIFCMHETVVLRNVSAAGVDYVRFVPETFQTDLGACTLPWPTNVDVSLSMTLASSTSAQGWIEVYEVYAAQPLYKSPAFWSGVSAGTLISSSLKALLGDYVVAACKADSDTVTVTWTGVNEDSDVDGGTLRASAGHVGPQGSTTEFAVTATLSGSSSAGLIQVSVEPEGTTGVKGSWHGLAGAAIASGAFSLPSSSPEIDCRGIGSGDLLIAVYVEGGATVSGITWGGVAMTARGSVTNTGATPDLHISLWSIPFTQAAPTGAIAGTMSGAGADSTTAVLTTFILYDVGSYGTAGTATGNSTGANTSINTQDGGMRLAFSIRAATAGLTWTGANEIRDSTLGLPYATSAAQLYYDTAGTGVAVGATGPNEQWATIALPINP
jgi:hypothetical protein